MTDNEKLELYNRELSALIKRRYSLDKELFLLRMGLVGLVNGEASFPYFQDLQSYCDYVRECSYKVYEQVYGVPHPGLPNVSSYGVTTTQLQAQSDRSDFIEDCIAEMATVVYGDV